MSIESKLINCFAPKEKLQEKLSVVGKISFHRLDDFKGFWILNKTSWQYYLHNFDAKRKLFLHLYVIEVREATGYLIFCIENWNMRENQFKIDVLNSIDHVNC